MMEIMFLLANYRKLIEQSRDSRLRNMKMVEIVFLFVDYRKLIEQCRNSMYKKHENGGDYVYFSKLPEVNETKLEFEEFQFSYK